MLHWLSTIFTAFLRLWLRQFISYASHCSVWPRFYASYIPFMGIFCHNSFSFLKGNTHHSRRGPLSSRNHSSTAGCRDSAWIARIGKAKLFLCRGAHFFCLAASVSAGRVRWFITYADCKESRCSLFFWVLFIFRLLSHFLYICAFSIIITITLCPFKSPR